MMSKLCGISLDFLIAITLLDRPHGFSDMYTAASKPFTLSDIFKYQGLI